MKIGQRIHVEFDGDLVRESLLGNYIQVQDDKGNLHKIANPQGQAVEPPYWPPQPGDVWKHLDVAFAVESRQGTVWMIPSNDEGSLAPDEVLRMRPGIRIVHRGSIEE